MDPTASPRYPRPTIRLDQADWLWRHLADAAVADAAVADPASDELGRLACAVAIARAAGGARWGELNALLVADVRPRRGSVRLTRFPQGRTSSPPVVQHVDLGDGELLVVRRWLRLRAGVITRHVAGAPPAELFVTIRKSIRGERVYPAGLPIATDGLEQSYRRFARRVNTDRAGTHGWTPLPTRFEQVRRAWAPLTDFPA